MKYLKSSLIVAAVLALLSLARLFYVVADVAKTLPVVAERTIKSEMALTRQDTKAMFDATEKDLVGQVAALRTDVFKQIKSIQGDTFKTLSDLRIDTDAQLDTTRTQLMAQLSRTNDSVAELVKIRSDIAPTVASVNEASGVLLRRDALPAQVLGVLGATKVTMGSVAQMANQANKAMPVYIRSTESVAGSVASITSDVSTFTNTITKPQPWYKKVLNTIAGFGTLASRIF
jgi:hypothetical protein